MDQRVFSDLEELILSGAISTPSYVFFEQAVDRTLQGLQASCGSLPVQHFFSFKTTPVTPVLARWLASGRPVEVVSEYEYLAALEVGFPPDRILVNGPGKIRWHESIREGSWIHIDSVREAEFFCGDARLSKSCNFGVRLAVKGMADPNDGHYSGQFGVPGSELARVLEIFSRRSVALKSVHFHLMSNIQTPRLVLESANEIAALLSGLDWKPKFFDIGGGIPAQQERSRLGNNPRWTMGGLLELLQPVFSSSLDFVEEVWLENGRTITESWAALVTQVQDVKVNRGCRYLICDGGRINNALVSDWDSHGMSVVPARDGEPAKTSVCGPTCAAWDWLERGMFPEDIGVGDHVIWQDAGAYHIPFETTFSHPLAAIYWVDGNRVAHVVRERQSFADWYSRIGGRPLM